MRGWAVLSRFVKEGMEPKGIGFSAQKDLTPMYLDLQSLTNKQTNKQTNKHKVFSAFLFSCVIIKHSFISDG
jgi:hypothetical protein